ncbi:hypothetical protein HaLaN_13829 [Haematococcus lacustris]|uniref:Uncharacterized protein n=1 Tax=Haematococcus lacustris TaxID=44745 RepID=A0A699ZD65_HAELA|nr:hypothetical protein HaLaN_13829 [Haematococcus lacustris]
MYEPIIYVTLSQGGGLLIGGHPWLGPLSGPGHGLRLNHSHASVPPGKAGTRQWPCGRIEPGAVAHAGILGGHGAGHEGGAMGHKVAGGEAVGWQCRLLKLFGCHLGQAGKAGSTTQHGPGPYPEDRSSTLLEHMA